METFGAAIAFANHCGIEPLDIADGRSRVRVALRPEHCNSFGIAHGGLICTILDVAMGTAARSKIGQPIMTLDMQVSFLSPGRGVLSSEGRVVRAGRSVVFCEADIRDEAGELVAKASGLFKPTSARKAGSTTGADQATD
jgi:uncharacterized protein (TIGR00369 family)